MTGFLGKGGFASVYAAFDKVIERTVAIKVLAVQAGQMEEEAYQRKLERFRREAKASARIAHANVVTVFDMGVMSDTGQPYIVMEVLHGHSLSDELRLRGSLHPRRVLPLFCGALDALSAAHELGIVHKDLKPSNLFLSSPGMPSEEVKIVDFGIARFDEEDAGLTGTGQVFGTARYFAPEYISEQLVTPALDVYQMGLILVELLCGLPAVRSNNPLECVMCHGRGQLEIPEALLSGPIAHVILRSVSLNLEVRYPDAGVFRDALREVDPETVPVVSPTAMTKRLNELSTSMRAISGLNVAVTGQARIPDSRLDVPVRPGPDSDEVVIDLAAALRAEQGEEPDTNPEAFTPPVAVPAPAPAASPRRSKALPALALASIALLGLFVAIAVGAVIGLYVIDDAPATSTPVAPTATANPGAPSQARPTPVGETVPSGDAKEAAAATHAPPADVASDDDQPAKEPVVADADKETPKESDALPAQDKKASVVQLRSSPSGANVYVDGKRRGSTPWDAEFAPDDGPREVQLRKTGYRSSKITLKSEDGPARSVSLKRLPPKSVTKPPVTKTKPARIPIAK